MESDPISDPSSDPSSDPILLSPSFSDLKAAGTGELLQGHLKQTNNLRNKQSLANHEGLVGVDTLRNLTGVRRGLLVCGTNVMVPPGYAPPSTGWFTRTAFAANFRKDHPSISKVLAGAQMVGGGGVWLCGGSVAASLQRPIAERKGFDDYDLFMTFGEGPFDVRLAWLKVHWLAELVRRSFTEVGVLTVISETLSKGCLTINISKCNGRVQEKYAKVQIILRGFKGLSRILHGFDIPVCAVAVCADDSADGLRLYMTGLAAYSHAACVFPVVPEWGSTSTHHRMVKYTKRGWGIEFPCLNLGETFTEGRTLTLACGLKLTPEKIFSPQVCSGNLSYGSASVDSDYDRDTMRQNSSDLAFSPYEYRKSKADAILAGREITLRTHYRSSLGNHGDMIGIPLEFDKFSRSGTPLTLHILPRHEFLNELLELVRHSITKRGALDGLSLQKLGLSLLEIFGLMTTVMVVQRNHPDRKIDLSETLQPMVIAALNRYDAVVQDEDANVVKRSLKYWIIDNPGAQFTGSLNPRSMTLRATYGSVYFRSTPLPEGDDWGACLGAFRVKHPLPGNDLCALCMNAIMEEDLIVVLQCKHKFHSVETHDCGGFNGRGIDRCPLCRKSVLAEAGGRPGNSLMLNVRFFRPAGESPAGELMSRGIRARLSVSEVSAVLASRQATLPWLHGRVQN